MKPRPLLALTVLAAAVLALAGCAAAAPATGTSDGRIAVVAATDVYGQVAQAIGGDRVSVTSIISSPSQDPHEFEASTKDQLAVSRADLVIVNGGGYDPFMDGLIKASGTKASVITAFAVADEKTAPGAEPNEHVFFDPAVMGRVAERIEADLARIDPSHATYFQANAKTFQTGIAKLETEIAAIKTAHAGAPAFATEPLPGLLLAASGLVDRTPPPFSEAVEAGRDVPPAALLEALSLIEGHHVDVVVTNAQAGGPETERAADAARTAGIPVLRFSETLPTGNTYLTWMGQNIADLSGALAR